MLNPHPLHSFHLPNMHAVRNLRHLLAPTRRHSFSISRHLRSSSSAQQWLQSIHIIPADADVPGASRAPTPPDPAESAVGVSGADEPEDPPSGGDASVLRAEPDRGVRTTVSPGVVFQRSERKKRGKEKMAWVCNNCGVSRGQWWGMCPSCKEWDTARKVADCERTGGFEAEVRGWLPRDAGGEEPQSLVDINKGMSDLEWRLPLPGIFGMEVARVLGGGVVPGSLILVGGDPGVGKSTLLLQIAGVLSEENGTKGSGRVLYVSGEESIDQIKNRADRMGITSNGIFLCSSTDIKVPRMDKRLIAVSKLGFKTCIIPASALKSLNDVDTSMKIMGCRNLKEVIQAIRNYKDENGGRAVD